MCGPVVGEHQVSESRACLVLARRALQCSPQLNAQAKAAEESVGDPTYLSTLIF